MAAISPEEHIFFVYDHTALEREEDDLKDAIVYFFPTTTNIQRQCSYCGQLMGLVDFFEMFVQSPPTVYTLAKNKFAIKRLGKFSLALAGSHADPNSVILNQLHYLHNLLVFYQHSLDYIESCTENKQDLISRMAHLWDCYWPFVRRYGDNMAAAFEALPKVDLPKTESSVFLRASHVLQRCQRKPQVLAGCIIFKSRILISQFEAAITSKLLLIKPQQANLPCNTIDPGFDSPQGIRLLSVYLSPEEYLQLNPEAVLMYEGEDKEPQSQHSHKQVIEIMKEITSECESTENSLDPIAENSETVTEISHPCATSMEVAEQLEQAMQSPETERKDCAVMNGEVVENSVVDAVENSAVQDGVLENSIEKVDDSNGSFEEVHHIDEKSPTCKNSEEDKCVQSFTNNSVNNGEVPTNVSQKSDEVFDSMYSAVESQSDLHVTVNESFPAVSMQETGDQKQSVIKHNCDSNVEGDSSDNPFKSLGSSESLKLPTTEIHKTRTLTSDSSDSTRSNDSTDKSISQSKRKKMSFKTSDLFKNIKMAAEKGTKAINQQSRSHPGSQSEGEDVKTVPKIENNMPSSSRQHRELMPEKVEVAVDPARTQELQRDFSILGYDIPPLVVSKSDAIVETVTEEPKLKIESSNTSLKSNCKNWSTKDQRIQNGKIEHCSCQGTEKSKVENSKIEDVQTIDSDKIKDKDLQSEDGVGNNLVASAESADVEISSKKSAVLVDKNGLVTLDLYIQGHGDLAIILMMEKGTTKEQTNLRSLWASILTHLGDLDVHLQDCHKALNKSRAQNNTILNYNYLTFDPFSRSLEGRIALSGGDLQPTTSEENHFCETSVKLHEQFQKHPAMTDVTLRHSSGSIYGKNNGVVEVFFQSRDPRFPGGPNEKDPALNLEERASRKLHKDQGMLLL